MVQAVYYFHLMNPIVMAIFAVGFLLVYRSDRALKSALLFAIGFGAGSLAFALTFVGRAVLDAPMLIHVCNFAVLVSTALIAHAITLHLNKPLHWSVPVLSTILVGALWLMAVATAEVSISRIGLTYGATSALATLALPAIWRSLYRPTGRILFVLLSTFVTLGLFRLAFTLMADPQHIVATHALDSLELVIATMVASLFTIAIAATLLFSLGIEIVRRLTRASGTDFLTGVPNRRGFQEQAEQALDRARRSPIHVSFVFADLDHFKQINDTLGHGVGDDVIAEFGQMLATMVRSADIVGRIGGEEFAVLLWNCDERGAQLFAKAARETWKPLAARILPEETRSTASFGIATRKGKDASLSALVDDADAALYCAKNAGRDCVRGSDGDHAAGTTSPRRLENAA